MRILLSEGASTSAREAITALSLGGHEVEVCDPDPHCLARFSSLVARVHRCPGLGADPAGYLVFVLRLLETDRYDVLLPIHEQGFLFAKAVVEIRPHTAVALPSFESYARLHNKATFSGLLDELGLPQPPTRLVSDRDELSRIDRFPLVLKAAIGTASRGAWIVRGETELRSALDELEAIGGYDDAVLVQDFASGALEHAQAVFAQGEMAGFHAWRQVTRGAGGGDAIKESVTRPAVRGHLAAIGERLRWHGAFTVDYILDDQDRPLYIDGNPRLVEPMGAKLAGVDLMDILLRVSRGEAPKLEVEGRAGVRSHMAMQALLGHALEGGTRASLIRESLRLLIKRGPYAGSREELTPVRLDRMSAVPALITALWLIASPRAAYTLPAKGWGSHLLTPAAIRSIRAMDDGRPGVA
jgi:hypothetical protein